MQARAFRICPCSLLVIRSSVNFINRSTFIDEIVFLWVKCVDAVLEHEREWHITLKLLIFESGKRSFKS